ncbi:MAG: QueT transporter family protein [Oscillospiraceae bacterium]|nr:QueT transporter family protein [Oscillospiraceae bacterium]
MKNLSVSRLVKLAVVTAIYVALTLALSSLSYGNIQFRIAEALMLLCFYRKDYSISLILGCLLANIFSTIGIVDMVFGTAATVLAVICMMYSPNIYVASIFPVIFNGLIVGAELYWFVGLPFWISALEVAFGEFVCVCVLGIIIFKLLEKNQKFMKLLTD